LFPKGLLRFLCIIPFFCALSPAYGAGGVWPLFSYDTFAGNREIEVFGPLFTWKAGEASTEWGVRPLLYRTNDPAQELRRWEVIYPLGKYQVKEGDGKAYLVPFSLFRDEITAFAPARRERASSFLTAFWGKTDTGERYGGFFPLAGRLKQRFSRDEITFYLWPLYSRIEDNEEITWRTPWPFFSRFGGAADGWYLWPLWGHKEREGEYKKGFVLWPCYAYVDQDLDTDNPLSKRFYLPLYATMRSPRGRADLFLPPFFFHQWAYDDSFEKWEFPWPFVTVVNGTGVRERQVFPLFRVRDEEQKKRRYVLWPLYKYEWDLMGNEVETVRRFLLINKYRVVKDEQVGTEAVDANLWPLFDYRRGGNGEVRFSVFSLLPLHDEGLERTLYPLVRVYRYNRTAQGETLADFLWGLYRRRTAPEFSSTQFAFLLRIEHKGAEYVSLSFLEGLVRYQRTPEGGKLGFFYMGSFD
jgi:hypothetical protein